MNKCKTVYKEVEVDITLDDFDTADLIDELEERGEIPAEVNGSAKDLITAIWLKRRNGNSDYQWELDKLIYQTIGQIV